MGGSKSKLLSYNSGQNFCRRPDDPPTYNNQNRVVDYDFIVIAITVRILAWTTPIQILGYRQSYGRINREAECETRVELEDALYRHNSRLCILSYELKV